MSSSTDQEIAIKEIRPKSLLRKFVPSFTTFILIVYFIISLLMNGGITPLVKRGFFCNDASINYPFKRDTISVRVLMVIALVIPGIVIKCCDRNIQKLIESHPNIYITMMRKIKQKERKMSEDIPLKDGDELDVEMEELIQPQSPARRRLVVNEGESESELLDNNSDDFTAVPLDDDQEQSRLSIILRKTFGDFQSFLFGFCTTMLFTGMGKIICGRFRPHFMQRCQPDVDCSSFNDEFTYVEKFTCTNDKLTQKDMSYITTSWPSGHAAIMFFSMTYLIVYLNRAMTIMYELNSSRYPKGLSPILINGIYVLMIGLAGYIAGTRVSDFHHHALDVFSGALIGFAISMLLTRSIPMKVSLN